MADLCVWVGLFFLQGAQTSAATSAVPWRYNEQLEEFEKEQRRKCRVEKKLQEMVVEKQEKTVEQTEEVYHDIVEFAQNYFNTHEKCADGECAERFDESLVMCGFG